MLSSFPRFFAFAGLLLTVLFWAGNAVLARAVTQEIPPMALAFGRWLVAFAVIFPFGLPYVVKERKQLLACWKQLIWLSLLSVALYNCLLYVAAHTTSALNITLVSSSMPVITIVLVWLLLKRRPSHAQVIGIIIVFSGLAVIMGGFSLQTWQHLQFRKGDFLMLLASLCWAFYTVQYKQWQINDFNPIGLTTVLVGLGCIMIMPAYVFEYYQQGGFQLNKVNMLAFIYAGIFPSILAFLFWNKSVVVLGPAISSICSNLMPLFTAILAYYLLKESLVLQHYVGGGLMLTGLFISSR